ncbi:LrgB family protein [Shewanella yunxiaonensis]|uniref:LrgB family protein n=1 Tax=Shewanella yunxiaonensis TaxID=2829809 RepID=A0ABX7YW78_9GAMM|nr:LrgB family protein [Shewanella yunxiaonensis]QUN06411.1 LrgB family protein [Shewanella yunxiaonensis]
MIDSLLASLQSLKATPEFAVGLTMVAFQIALWFYRKTKIAILQPVIVAVTIVITVLLILDVPYADYRVAAEPVAFLIGPATIALAVPLYSQLRRIRQLFGPILITLVCGGGLTVALSVLFCWLLGGSEVLQMSLAPRSVTMPIAILVSDSIGGNISLTAAFVMITGVFGAAMAPWLFKLFQVTEPAARGLSYGINAHAMGTVQALDEGEECGAFSALGMGLFGVLLAVVLPLLL